MTRSTAVGPCRERNTFCGEPSRGTLPRMETIRVRLMNDYCADWPLWTDGMAGEDEFELSQPLKRRLTAWASFFNSHFHWDTGWDSPEACAQHRAEGEQLHRLLAAELGPGYEVVLDTWETEDGEDSWETSDYGRWLRGEGEDGQRAPKSTG